jgi:hypothetical protein
VFKMMGAFVAMAVVTPGSGATYLPISRVPKTTTSSILSGSGSRDDAEPL